MSDVANTRLPEEKRCIKCREWKTIKHFSIYRYTTSQGKQSRRADSRCKECVPAIRRKRYAVRKSTQSEFLIQQRKNQAIARDKNRKRWKPELIAKLCLGCGLIKKATDYYRRPATGDGYYVRCKLCTDSQRQDLKAKIAIGDLKAKHRAKHVRQYGITIDQYDAMYAEQAGKCAVCQEAKSILCIDHNHGSGAVRGLLCKRCNWVLGHVDDSSEVLDALSRYIRRHSEAACAG